MKKLIAPALVALTLALAACSDGGSTTSTTHRDQGDPAKTPTCDGDQFYSTLYKKCLQKPDETTTTTTTAPAAPPAPTDFAVALKIKSKECFGDAGCSVTAEQTLTLLDQKGKADYDLDITYEIDGGQDGPIIQTTTLHPDGQYTVDSIVMETPSNATVPTVKITSVSRAAA